MTTMKPTTTPSRRPRTLQDDLLADLRQAAPMMPVAPLETNHSAPVPPERVDPTLHETPTIDVRVTPRQWSTPSMRPGGTETGLVFTVGPLRVSITGFSR